MDKIFQKILKIAFYASVVPLMTLVVLTMLDVGARYVFNSAIKSTLEISQLLLSMLIALAMGYTTYIKDNFSVSFVAERLPKKIKPVLDVVSSLIAAGVCFVLTIQATTQALYSTKGAEFTGALEVPVYPTKWLFAFGCLLIAIVLMVHFTGALRRGRDESTGVRHGML